MYTPTQDSETHSGYHRMAVVAFITLGNAGLLTLALSQLAGACMMPGSMQPSFVLIAAGLAPFSMSVQIWRDTPMAQRMRMGRFYLFASLVAMAVLIGPGPAFLGLACGSGPTMVQTATAMMAVSWIAWAGLRFSGPTFQRR